MSAKEMKHVEFYECEVCGNVMVKLVDGGVTPDCCGAAARTWTPPSSDRKTGAPCPLIWPGTGRSWPC